MTEPFPITAACPGTCVICGCHVNPGERAVHWAVGELSPRRPGRFYCAECGAMVLEEYGKVRPMHHVQGR